MTFDTVMELASIPLLACGMLAYQMGWHGYVLVVSSLHVVFGLRLFLCRGGVLLTASGVYGLASAVFLGLPPLWTYLAGVYPIDALDILVSGISFSVLAVTDLVLRLSGTQERMAASTMTISPIKLGHVALRRTLSLSAVLFAIGSAMKMVGFPLSRETVYVSALFAGLVAVTAMRDRKWPLAMLSGTLTLAIVVVYLRVHFDAFGRLGIATFGMCFLLLAGLIWKRKWVKAVPLVASGPLLVVAAQIRSDSIITMNRLLVNPIEGLGSMLAPYFTFKEIISRFGMPGSLCEFELEWGRTLLSSVLFWVPRSLWPSKPPGLGFRYTLWLRPHLASVKHSMAGSYLGELYVNFGILGLAIAPLVLGKVLELLDRSVYQLSNGPTSSHMIYCWKVVMTAILVTSLADYVWGSTFTQFVRAGSCLIVLITIAGIRLLLGGAITRKSHT